MPSREKGRDNSFCKGGGKGGRGHKAGGREIFKGSRALTNMADRGEKENHQIEGEKSGAIFRLLRRQRRNGDTFSLRSLYDPKKKKKTQEWSLLS